MATELQHRPKVNIGGILVDAVSRSDLTQLAVRDAVNRRSISGPPKLVFDANGHAISLAASDKDYRQALKHADIIHADGGALVSFSRQVTDTPIPERSATTDMIHDLARAFAQHGLTFFLLGAEEEVNKECAEILEAEYPGLKVVGRHHGYFDELGDIAESIRISRPDVIWVGLGKPLEQQVSLKLQQLVQASWIVTCGGCFNFVTGKYKRAPMWMQRANLEWLHRLGSNPRKLFLRYLVTNPHALYLMVRHAGKPPVTNT